MKKDLAIKHFKKSFFWDCDPKEIKLEEDYPLIIERVLSQSLNLNEDLKKLDTIYLKSIIKRVALSSTQIFGNERIQFIANRYNLKVIDFYRYYI